MLGLLLAGTACSSTDDHVIVLGQPFATEAPVVTWHDEGGYDGHQETCWFTPERQLPSAPANGCDTLRRYSQRRTGHLPAALQSMVAERGWEMDSLRDRIDQVVLHFDACGCSRRCFEVLHDIRGLSCHFLIDVDGTVYQTLDLAARARHATIANDRSIGIEIAQIGAYRDTKPLEAWYAPAAFGHMQLTFPETLGDPAIRTPGFVGYTARPGLFRGLQNGRDLVQYDFTEEQYRSLELLLRSLRTVFPRISPQVPRTEDGQVATGVLPRAQFLQFTGVLGHHHVQANKSDPGPAFHWERIASVLNRPSLRP